MVEIPCEGTTIPGYFLQPDASGQRRPTLSINGSRGAVVRRHGSLQTCRGGPPCQHSTRQARHRPGR
jgi:hypothetical protein